MKIQTKATGTIEAVFTGENPKTAEAVWTALPVKGSANRWGDEIYFSTSVVHKEENARTEVEIGSIAYWPPGKAICVFFGPTPVSKHGEPRAYSPVNVFAKIVGDAAAFKKVHDNDEVVLEKREG